MQKSLQPYTIPCTQHLKHSRQYLHKQILHFRWKAWPRKQGTKPQHQMESGLPFHFQLLDFTLTWKAVPFLFSSIHHSCQFTGSSTHTSIYRQFHSSVYRRFNPYINLHWLQFHSHINLQAVPLTHRFTGNFINTKNACTIYIRVQVIPATQKVHTPLTPIYRQFHTPLTPIYRQFHTPLTPIYRQFHTPLTPIYRQFHTPLTPIYRQFHTPFTPTYR